MFKNLFDFSVKRSGLNAFGFYIVYTLLGGLFCGLFCAALAVVYCMLNPIVCSANGTDVGVQIGRTFGLLGACIYTFAIGVGLLTAKKLWKSIPSLFLFIASVPVALICGYLFSMILLSIITTFGDKNLPADTCENEQENENKPQ